MNVNTPMTITFQALGCKKQVVHVDNYKEASQAMRGFLDANYLGASELRGTCGDINVDGKKVGHVSYNGRVWDLNGEEITV